jgi:purine-nucleoside phosphorylase
MPTPHNRAKENDFAKTVLMPGDPLRAKWISETFLKDAKLINDVRGMLGFTGLYKDKKVSVMGHGMGIASIGIYSYELFKFYGVETILRVGSAGAYSEKIKVGDIIIAESAFSFSTYADEVGVEVKNNTLNATPSLVNLTKETAKELGLSFFEGKVYSSDAFYNKYTLQENIQRTQGCAAVEMEAFALYANAIKLSKQALTILTCSDSLVTGDSLSAEDRQTSFSAMIKLALAVAYKL